MDIGYGATEGLGPTRQAAMPGMATVGALPSGQTVSFGQKLSRGKSAVVALEVGNFAPVRSTAPNEVFEMMARVKSAPGEGQVSLSVLGLVLVVGLLLGRVLIGLIILMVRRHRRTRTADG